MTKEGDRDVVRAYVALAEAHPDDIDDAVAYEKELVEKEKAKARGTGTVEDAAVDRYMDDDEWEARERNEGRGVSIPRFPLFDSGGASSSKSVGKWPMGGWMRWNVKA